MDINNPDQRDSNTKQWIKRGFSEEYKSMSEDYNRRYSIRLEKILHTALKKNPMIDQDLALVI